LLVPALALLDDLAAFGLHLGTPRACGLFRGLCERVAHQNGMSLSSGRGRAGVVAAGAAVALAGGWAISTFTRRNPLWCPTLTLGRTPVRSGMAAFRSSNSLTVVGSSPYIARDSRARAVPAWLFRFMKWSKQRPSCTPRVTCRVNLANSAPSDRRLNAPASI